jgi:hypothetical protein
VRRFVGDEDYQTMIRGASEIFRRGDIPELIRALDRDFGAGTFSLRYLFRDEQRKVVASILEHATDEASALYRSFYSQYGTLIRFVTDLGIPLPPRFHMAVDFTLNENLLNALAKPDPDAAEIDEMLDQIRRAGFEPDKVTLEFSFRRTVEHAAEAFRDHPDDLEHLREFQRIAAICPSLPFEVNLWVAQNIYFVVTRARSEQYRKRAEAGDETAREWLASATALGEILNVNTSHLTTASGS